MNERKFTLGFQFGTNYEDEDEIAELKESMLKDLKEEFPNITIDFDYVACDVEVIGYAFDIIDLEGDSHQEARKLREEVYEIIGWLLGDFH